METVGLRAKHLPYPVCLQRGSSLAFPDKFYLWQQDKLKPNHLPNYIIDATSILQPYFAQVNIQPQRIYPESFELMMGSWLGSILHFKTSPQDLNTSEQWLLDSGLYQALSGGQLKYGGECEYLR